MSVIQLLSDFFQCFSGKIAALSNRRGLFQEQPMPQVIQTIPLPLPFRLGSVNCYLLKNESGCLLIDTGATNQRSELERHLESAGCRLGGLKLVVLTHGDFDHTGNAAYLRLKFDVKIAMHAGDAGMLVRGDMSWNRKRGHFLLAKVVPLLFKFGGSERCEPDFYLDDGSSLVEFGFDARVLALPGHSAGSIGILAAVGDPSTGSRPALVCGDLLDNTRKPTLNSIMDDPPAASASLQKLKSLPIGMVYPGHGRPFPAALLPQTG
jgi:hydroxyacylglutathione hydrolase